MLQSVWKQQQLMADSIHIPQPRRKFFSRYTDVLSTFQIAPLAKSSLLHPGIQHT